MVDVGPGRRGMGNVAKTQEVSGEHPLRTPVGGHFLLLSIPPSGDRVGA